MPLRRLGLFAPRPVGGHDLRKSLSPGVDRAHIHRMSRYVDYWVAVRRRTRLPKPYTWEIRSSRRAVAVMRCYVPFKNKVMARIGGERALKRLLRKLNI